MNPFGISVDADAVRVTLSAWSSADSAFLADALRSLSARESIIAASGPSPAASIQPPAGPLETRTLEQVLSSEQQAAFARYVFSNGRSRKDSQREPFVFLRDAAEKLRAPPSEQQTKSAKS
jgi:hypothetical protein